MKQEEKRWHSLPEVLAYLHIDAPTLPRKVQSFHLETRTLPGLRGEYLSQRDMEVLTRGLIDPTSLA